MRKQFQNSPYSAKMDLNKSRIKASGKRRNSKKKHSDRFRCTHAQSYPSGIKHLDPSQLSNFSPTRRKLVPVFHETNVCNNTFVREVKSCRSTPTIHLVEKIENGAIDIKEEKETFTVNTQKQTYNPNSVMENCYIPLFSSKRKVCNRDSKEENHLRNNEYYNRNAVNGDCYIAPFSSKRKGCNGNSNHEPRTITNQYYKELAELPSRQSQAKPKRHKRKYNKSIYFLSRRTSDIDSSEENKTSEDDLYCSSSESIIEQLDKESIFKNSKNLFQLKNQLIKEGLCYLERTPKVNTEFKPRNGKFPVIRYSKYGTVNFIPYLSDSFNNDSDNSRHYKSKHFRSKYKKQVEKIEPHLKNRKSSHSKHFYEPNNYSLHKNPQDPNNYSVRKNPYNPDDCAVDKNNKDHKRGRNDKESTTAKKSNHPPEEVNRGRQPMSIINKTAKQKVTDEELWKTFQITFKSYTTTKRHSGDVIPHYISTRWLKNVGVIDELMTDKEAETAFKRSAGQKITMNVHEYKDFILSMTAKLKLPFYALYKRMCGI